jgi:hypothetical protein
VEEDRSEHPVFERAARLLDERGRDLASGRIRVAADRAGVVVAFPRKPLIHVSSLALLAVAVVVGIRRSRRRAGR